MQHKKVFVLDEKDLKISDTLIEMGVSKNIARSILFLAQTKKECNSLDIESGSGLRQPEVSIAMQKMIEKNWVTLRKVKKTGKGRPVHLYKINISMNEFMDEIEKEKNKEIEKIRENLKEIKSLISLS